MNRPEAVALSEVVSRLAAVGRPEVVGRPAAVAGPEVVARPAVGSGPAAVVTRPAVESGPAEVVARPAAVGRPGVVARSAAVGHPGVVARSAAVGHPGVVGRPAFAAWARRLLWRSVFRAAGGFEVTGPLPGGGCVVVANHSSHADAPALVAALPASSRPVVAAAADHWFRGRGRARLCRLAVGAFPVRRTGGGSADLSAVIPLLQAGRAVVVFPEGTRSRSGEMAEFRSGAFRLAAAAGVPVVPVGLVGTRDLKPVEGRGHRGRVAVRFGAPLHEPDPAVARAEVGRLAAPLFSVTSQPGPWLRRAPAPAPASGRPRGSRRAPAPAFGRPRGSRSV